VVGTECVGVADCTVMEGVVPEGVGAADLVAVMVVACAVVMPVAAEHTWLGV